MSTRPFFSGTRHSAWGFERVGSNKRLLFIIMGYSPIGEHAIPGTKLGCTAMFSALRSCRDTGVDQYLNEERNNNFLEPGTGWQNKEKAQTKADKNHPAKFKFCYTRRIAEKSNTYAANKEDIMQLLNTLWLGEDKGIEMNGASFRAANKGEPMTTMDDVKEFLQKEPLCKSRTHQATSHG